MGLIEELSGLAPKFLESNRDAILEKFSRKMEQAKSHRKYFSQLWEAYAWATIIGLINDKPLKLNPIDHNDSVKNDAFKFSVIINNGEDIAYALILAAIAKSDKGLKILESPNEIIQLLSEYANGGFQIIKEKIAEDPNIFQNPNDYIKELLERS
ncbi:MAG: hypothetical protein H6540_07665 [Bacteroidales bacterium]|nr:hypothetical protein [Bacteroidales bacterium]